MNLSRLRELARNPQARRDLARWRTRRLFFRVAKHFTPIVAVDAQDGRYLVSTRDQMIGYWTFMNGSFDADTLQKGMALLGAVTDGEFSLEGRTTLDIGANIGTQTVPLIGTWSAGRVIAIEPDPGNATLLRQNVVANGYERAATVLELAVSNVDGVVQLERSDVNPGDHRVRVAGSDQAARMGEENRALVDVRAARIDSLIAEGAIPADDVALIWMDTQGHEGHVLAGATRLLGRVPVITEYWPYGLRRAGGLELFHTLVAEHFRTVIDLGSGGGHGLQRLPAGEVASLASRYVVEDDSRESTTDLLLLPASNRSYSAS
jgi:FkbM family methyltransferase